MGYREKYEKDISTERRVYGPKMLLAGCESRPIRNAFVRIKVRNILVSYYYLRTKCKTMLNDIEKLKEDFSRFDFVFLDSGGFTLLNDNKNEEGDRKERIMEYTKEYNEFIIRTKDVWSACAEVDAIEDLDREWMEEQKDMLLAKEVPIVPVYQAEPIGEIYERGWFDKYDYIAIGSIMNCKDKQLVQKANEFMAEAKKHKIVVHGFGMTTAELMKRAEFYTCDSTTWLSGAKFGCTQVFQNGRIRVYDHHNKEVRKRLKNHLVENGVIWEHIEQDKAFEVNIMSALSWREYAEHVGKRLHGAYWLTPEEKTEGMAIVRKDNAGVINAESRGIAILDKPSDDTRLNESTYCDSCFINQKCPQYKAGNKCVFPVVGKLDTAEKMLDAFQSVVGLQTERIMRASLFEKLETGVLDKQITSDMGMLMKMFLTMKKLQEENDSIIIHAKGNKPTESIVQKIFGDIIPKKEAPVEAQ